MMDTAQGKSKVSIEIQHFNGNTTFCFILLDEPQNLHSYIVNTQDFLPVLLLSGEMIYISKSDIRAFRALDVKEDKKEYIWSFDPYRVLGVDQDISLEALHTKYITLLKSIHPEIIEEKQIHPVFKDLASDLTRRVISAYEYIRAEKLSHGA